MRKHIQQCAYPYGDCVRTTIACILDSKHLHDVPNFMQDGEEFFTEYFDKWLIDNNLQYIEMDLKSFQESPNIPLGYCSIIGKSPTGNYDHMVVGKIEKEGNIRNLYFYHNPAEGYSDVFIDGEIKWIGFLVRTL